MFVVYDKICNFPFVYLVMEHDVRAKWPPPETMAFVALAWRTIRKLQVN